jgi:tRNA-Thr(GGU) m(6)t(6)A37 methyltransferase TsaA
MTVSLTPIATLHSPFKEKFGIPRQPGLAPHALSRLVLHPPYASAECLEGLEGFSHVWLIFLFHGTQEQGWKPRVRPPRLGGNERLGVFATRTMFRPNPLGLSLVELVGIVDGAQGKELVLRGADLLDGTPIVDIKPYLPYVEALPDARAGFAPQAPALLPVHWSPEANAQAEALAMDGDLRALINEVLAQDPRPAYADDPAREYGVRLARVNVRFVISATAVTVLAVNA